MGHDAKTYLRNNMGLLKNKQDRNYAYKPRTSMATQQSLHPP